MSNSVKLTAEQKFQAAQNKTSKIQAEKEHALQKRNEQITSLKSRRMAKEAAERQATALVAKEKRDKQKKQA